MEDPDDDDIPLLPSASRATRSIIDASIQSAFTSQKFGVGEWLQEVRAVSQAAAASGVFDVALKGYEMLGKHLGANISDAAPINNHLHLHDADLMKEASDEDIMANIAHLKRQEAAQGSQPSVIDASLDQALEDLM